MNIYVGNLSYQVTDEELRAAFETFGEVSNAAVIRDKETGRSKGFGFVEMPDQTDAEAAIKAVNDTDLQGRTVVVNQARPRTESPRRDREGFRRREGHGGRPKHF